VVRSTFVWLTGLAIIAGLAGTARADSPKLGEAETAIEQVRYDDARRLLVEAIETGDNSPAAVRRIYELSASTAIVLGQRELGEQYYRRWLALQPDARLPDGSSPKLTEAFVAAQAFMAAHGRLIVRAARDATSDEVDVAVESDPLHMAAAIAVAGAAGSRVAIGADHHARLAAGAAALQIDIVDEHGNHLLVLDVGAAVATLPPPVAGPTGPIDDASPPLSRRWTTWAVPAGVFLAGGLALGTLAITEQGQLDGDLAKSGEHFFDDIQDRHDKIRLHATIAIALGGVGLVFAIPATIFYVRAQRPWQIGTGVRGVQVTVRPILGPGVAGVAGTF